MREKIRENAALKRRRRYAWQAALQSRRQAALDQAALYKEKLEEKARMREQLRFPGQSEKDAIEDYLRLQAATYRGRLRRYLLPGQVPGTTLTL